MYPTIEGFGWQGSVGAHCMDCYLEKWSILELPGKQGEDPDDPLTLEIKVAELSENQWSTLPG